LRVWESGIGQTPVNRALSLLEAACPEATIPVEQLTIGQRDSLLLTLRERMFGERLESVVECPQCREKVELQLETGAMRQDSKLPPSDGVGVVVADYDLRVRPLNSVDLRVAGSASRLEQKRRILFERCLLSAVRKGEPVGADQLPPEVMDIVATKLGEVDPQADVQFNIACPSCGANWLAPFDIVAFLWSEVEAWACRLLQDIHALAAAYGWTERDVLALSPLRRQLYLELVSP
jgi:hypothetical protein